MRKGDGETKKQMRREGQGGRLRRRKKQEVVDELTH